MLLFTICRFIFYVYQYSFFQSIPTHSTLTAFLLGLKFDLSIVTTFNLIPLVLIILVIHYRIKGIYLFLLKCLMVVANLFILILNLIDIEYFSFTGKRTGIEILGIYAEIKQQAFQLIFNYFDVVIFSILFTIMLIWFIFKITMPLTPNVHNKKSTIQFIIVVLLIIGMGILSIRGGLQLKPLRPNMAFTIHPNKLGHLALNTPFNIIMSIGTPPIEKIQYFKTDNEAKAYIKKYITTSTQTTPSLPKNTNVVILILESFNREYMGYGNPYEGYTPFLDSLANQSLFFKNGMANGRKSMEAVPSVLSSLPAFMEEPYITSIYQTNKIEGLGNILLNHGYHTSFYHGAMNGSMGFDAFTKNVGMTHYDGLNEYPNINDFDGHWGIYDGPYLQYFIQQLNHTKKPFASTLFTLSSHQPYSIPDSLDKYYIPGDLEIHQCIRYVDDMVRQFFNQAKKTSWYKNTLFVITADHTHMHSEKSYTNIRGDFNIPILFYHPTKKLQADTSLIAQQTDILPSILDLLKIDNPTPTLFGQSVFKKQLGFALNYSNGVYRLMLPTHYIEGNGKKIFISKNYKDEVITNLPDEILLLQAFIQIHNNGLINNSIYQNNTP